MYIRDICKLYDVVIRDGEDYPVAPGSQIILKTVPKNRNVLWEIVSSSEGVDASIDRNGLGMLEK